MAKASELMVLIRAKDTASGVLNNLSSTMQRNQKTFRDAGIGFAAMGAAVGGVLALSTKSFMGFEQAITNAVSVTGYMGEEADAAKAKLADLARQLGKDTVYSATEVASAMYDLASKGFKPAEMALSDLQPYLDLAAATQADLATSTQITTSAVRAFGLSTEDAGRVADVFTKVIGSSAATIDKLGASMAYVAPVAKAAGMSIEETSAALGALYNTGLDASMAGTAFRGMLATLMSPAGDLKAVLTRLNLSMADVSLESKSLTDILRVLQDRGMTNAEVMDVFGRRAGPAALSLMGVTNEGIKTVDVIDELTKVLLKAGGTAEMVANMQIDTLTGRTKLAKSALVEMGLSIGDALLPALTSFGNLLINILRPIGNLMKNVPILTNVVVYLGAAFTMLALPLGAFLLLGPKVLLMILAMKVAFVGLAIKLWAAVVALYAFLSGLGPLGWGIMAGGLAAAGAAVYGLTKLMSSAVPSMHQGGIVPGPIGQPVPIMALGGERFLGAGGGGGGVVNVNIGILTGDRESYEQLQDIIQQGQRGRQRISTGSGLY